MFYETPNGILLNLNHIRCIDHEGIVLGDEYRLRTTPEHNKALRDAVAAAGLLPVGEAVSRGELEIINEELNEEIAALNGRLRLHGSQLTALKETLDQMAPPAVQNCTRSAGHPGPCNGYPGTQCSGDFNGPKTLSWVDEDPPLHQSEFHINVEKSFDEVNEKLIRILSHLEPATLMSVAERREVVEACVAAAGGEPLDTVLSTKIHPEDQIAYAAITNFITPLIQNIESAKYGYLDLSDTTLLHSLEAWHAVLLKLKAHLQPTADDEPKIRVAGSYVADDVDHWYFGPNGPATALPATPGQLQANGFTWTMPAASDDEIAAMFEGYEEPTVASKECAATVAEHAVPDEIALPKHWPDEEAPATPAVCGHYLSFSGKSCILTAGHSSRCRSRLPGLDPDKKSPCDF